MTHEPLMPNARPRLLLEVVSPQPEYEMLEYAGQIIDIQQGFLSTLFLTNGWVRIVAEQPCLGS